MFNDKLTFKYVEITKFDKPLEELHSVYDKWLYALKNLPRLSDRPKELRDKVFDRLFEEAEIAKFSTQELKEYEDSLKAYRDIKNSLDTAMEQGFEKGREEGINSQKLETARSLLEDGLPLDKIMCYTGLSCEEINRL